MIQFIQGGIAKDHRGQIRFVNDFDMEEVKRFYVIKNVDTDFVRGWRGHRIEKRWFYVLSGSFLVSIVRVNDWENASRNLPVENQILKADDSRLLHVAEGHCTAFQAMEKDSELLVFANFSIENSKNDDYTWPIDYFLNRKI